MMKIIKTTTVLLVALCFGVMASGCLAAMDEPEFDCYDDDECPKDKRCFDDVCKPAGAVCEESSCYCSIESDCPKGFVCENEKCYKEIELADCLKGACECGTYSVCPEEYECVSGVCMTAEEKEKKCREGECECEEDEECPEGMVCGGLDVSSNHKCMTAEHCDQGDYCSCWDDEDCLGQLICVDLYGGNYCHSAQWCISSGKCRCDYTADNCPDGTFCVKVDLQSLCYTFDKCVETECGCYEFGRYQNRCPDNMYCLDDTCQVSQ